MDAGPIADREPFAIGADDCHGVVVSRAAGGTAVLAERFLAALERHGAALPLAPQDESRASLDPRPGPEDLVIDWTRQPARDVCALVRACNPAQGGAIASFRGASFRVFEATPAALEGDARGLAPGTVASAAGGPMVACADGEAVRLDVLYTDAGLFGGARFAATYGVTAGEALEVVATGTGDPVRSAGPGGC